MTHILTNDGSGGIHLSLHKSKILFFIVSKIAVFILFLYVLVLNFNNGTNAKMDCRVYREGFKCQRLLRDVAPRAGSNEDIQSFCKGGTRGC